MSNIMIDRRMKSKIDSIYEYDNGACSIKFNDLNDTFWFNNRSDLQEFINQIAKERYYDKEVRNGYFDYINEHNEKFRYYVTSNRGKLTLLKEECVG